MGKSKFSARECTQTLTPIPQGTLRRTINGDLVYVGHKGHRKFQSTLSCKDKVTPAFGEFWKGTVLKVGCIQCITQTVPPQALQVQLERDPLSCHLYEKSGKIVSFNNCEGRVIFLPSDFPGGFVSYRPLLIMSIKNYEVQTDEWGLTVGWTLEVEEV